MRVKEIPTTPTQAYGEQFDFLTTENVAEILHVSKRTVYTLIERGQLKGFKSGNRVLFTKSELQRYIDGLIERSNPTNNATVAAEV